MAGGMYAQEFLAMSDERPQIVTEDSPEFFTEANPQIETSSASFRLGAALAVAVLAFAGLFGYTIHERNLAQQLAHENDQTASALKETRSQMGVLSAKLDEIAGARQPVMAPASGPVTHTRLAVVRHAKPDPRWMKLQTQLDAQGKAIDETRTGLESTRGDLLSTRTGLQDSIAKTHDELVVLQRKGARNYYEFDLDKSKHFARTGPVTMSLRKANTKHQYADLELIVDDRQVSKKHLNLYEPAMFYPGDAQQPLELVINDIGKNHIRGYVSAPKYRTSELTLDNNVASVEAFPEPVSGRTLQKRAAK